MLQNQRDLLGPERAEQLSRHLALLDSSRRVHPLPQSALGGATEDRVDGAAKLVEALRGQLAALRLEQALDAGGGHLLQRQLVQLGEKSLSEEAFEGSSKLAAVLSHPPIEQLPERHRRRFFGQRLE